MTVSEVRGFGRQRGVTEVFRAQEVEERLLRKLKLDIAVSDAFVEAATEAIVRGARSGATGSVGDGKVFVIPLDASSAFAPARPANARSARKHAILPPCLPALCLPSPCLHLTI